MSTVKEALTAFKSAREAFKVAQKDPTTSEDDKKEQRLVLDRTVSGGVTINDVVWHFGQDSLPFGGVGHSGIGAYHGEHGFKLFSKEKPVFTQSSFSTLFLLFPPYGKMSNFVVSFVKKII